MLGIILLSLSFGLTAFLKVFWGNEDVRVRQGIRRSVIIIAFSFSACVLILCLFYSIFAQSEKEGLLEITQRMIYLW